MLAVFSRVSRPTFRHLVLAGCVSLVSAAAVAAPILVSQQTPPAEAQTPSPTAEAFADSLVGAIMDTLEANSGLTDLAALQALLEAAIEALFLESNVTPEAALAGVEIARGTLTTSGAMCDLPEGAATQRCEAVALAFQLAERAAIAAQPDPTGATGDSSGAALGPPPSAGSGGGGGGVTHPPVTL